MLNELKLTPAASSAKFVDYDSEAAMSTSGCDCTSRRVMQPSHRDSYDNQCTKGLNAQCFIVFGDRLGDEM